MTEFGRFSGIELQILLYLGGAFGADNFASSDGFSLFYLFFGADVLLIYILGIVCDSSCFSCASGYFCFVLVLQPII